MARALRLAWRGWGRVHPNPLVGAVLLKDGKQLSEGYHREFGGPHAEVAALGACAEAKGATMVVTLEPCTHHGQTPPCSEALIAAGVRRVVFAIADPHPRAGGGAARLAAAGIEVERGLLADAAAAQNAMFLWAETRPERPFVALKLAASLDGFLADHHGRSRWIAGERARRFVHWLRAGFDAIGVGRVTAEADDPQLTVRGRRKPRRAPVRVVFGRSGRLSPTLRLVETADRIPTLFVSPEAGSAPPGVEHVAAPDLAGALGALRGRGIRSLLVEGGGRLAGALLDADLVDRIYWIQAPVLLGDGRRAFAERRGAALGEARRWTVTQRRSLGDDTLLVVDRALCLPES